MLRIKVGVGQSSFIVVFRPFAAASSGLGVLSMSSGFFSVMSIAVGSRPVIGERFSPLGASGMAREEGGVRGLFLVVSFCWGIMRVFCGVVFLAVFLIGCTEWVLSLFWRFLQAKLEAY